MVLAPKFSSVGGKFGRKTSTFLPGKGGGGVTWVWPMAVRWELRFLMGQGCRALGRKPKSRFKAEGQQPRQGYRTNEGLRPGRGRVWRD